MSKSATALRDLAELLSQVNDAAFNIGENTELDEDESVLVAQISRYAESLETKLLSLAKKDDKGGSPLSSDRASEALRDAREALNAMLEENK